MGNGGISPVCVLFSGYTEGASPAPTQSVSQSVSQSVRGPGVGLHPATKRPGNNTRTSG